MSGLQYGDENSIISQKTLSQAYQNQNEFKVFV